MNNCRYDKKHRKVGYNYLSLKTDNIDNLFSLPANDLKTIMRALNNYVNSDDMKRTLLSAKEGIRSYKKAFDSSKYRVIFICSPTAMSGLIMTYSCHYLLDKNKKNRNRNHQSNFNTETGEIEVKNAYNPRTGIPYDNNFRKYFATKDEIGKYFNKHPYVKWGMGTSEVTGKEYYYVELGGEY